MDASALTDLGWAEDAELKKAHEEHATKNNMHESGPYVVQGVWKKGLVTLKFEQNTAAEPDNGSGLSSVTTHPAVCIIEGPKGRVAVNADDTALILDEADKLV